MNNLMRSVIRIPTFSSLKLTQFQPVLCSRNSTHDVISTTNDELTPKTRELDTLYKTLEIELRAPEPEAMKSYSMFARLAASELGITVGNCWTPFKHNVTDRGLFTTLRSSFAKKDYMVQYEVRTYFRYMTFHHLTGSTADTFLEYIERNLPESVAMKITKVSVEKLPPEITATLQQKILDAADSNQNAIEQK